MRIATDYVNSYLFTKTTFGIFSIVRFFIFGAFRGTIILFFCGATNYIETLQISLAVLGDLNHAEAIKKFHTCTSIFRLTRACNLYFIVSEYILFYNSYSIEFLNSLFTLSSIGF